MEIVLLITTMICAIGWLNSRILNRAVMYYYMEKKHQDEPDVEELKKYLIKAWKRFFNVDRILP